MRLDSLSDQNELIPEPPRETLRIVPRNTKAATFLGTLEGECGDHQVSPDRDGVGGERCLMAPVRFSRQKVIDRAVVPRVEEGKLDDSHDVSGSITDSSAFVA
jgi:hypothetical protein